MQDIEKVELENEIFKEKLDKAIEYLKNEYLIIRAGRANPHILDKVQIEYYGTMTPINQMANISVPEARVLMISVWDHSQLSNVSKAISVADLGVNPTDDGKVIRLIFPALTEERRKELTKQVKKLCEDAKIIIRNARRDVLDSFKSMKKNNEISEDELSTLESSVQKLVDKFVASCDALCAEKEKEVMEI